MIILTLAVAMAGALAQILVHDIIPTFFAGSQPDKHAGHQMPPPARPGAEHEGHLERGDLLSDTLMEEKSVAVQSFYQTEQFVWTLKWTHIHLFGMNMIFIFLGAITLMLNMSTRMRTWLVVLPFAGVLIDIASMWLKGYISPAFFWLHIPGGGLLGAVFIVVSVRGLWEMWKPRSIT